MKLVLSLLILISATCTGQLRPAGSVESKYTYRHLTTMDGLPQIQITSLFCDSKGFVWVGTKFGVARWDGRKFKVFTSREGAAGWQVSGISELDNGVIIVCWYGSSFNLIYGDRIETISLPAQWNANTVTSITALKGGNFLLGINGFGDEKNYKKSLVAEFDWKQKKFVREIWYPEWWLGKVFEDGYVITSDSNTTGTISQHYRLYRNNKFIEEFKVPAKLTHTNYSVPGTVRFFGNNRADTLYSFKVRNGHLEVDKSFTGISSPLTLTSAQTITQLDTGEYLYTTPQQDLRLLTSRGDQLISKMPIVNLVTRDKEDNVWLGTENGLYCFFRFGIQEYQFNASPGSIDAIWSMDRDKTGNYYYASYDKGFWMSKDGNRTWSSIREVDQSNADELMKKGTFGLRALSDGSVILPAVSGFMHYKSGKLKIFNLYGKGGEIYACWEDTVNKKVLISKHTFLFSFNMKTLKLDTLLNNYNVVNQPILNIVGDHDNNPIITGWVAPHIFKENKWIPIKGGDRVFGTSSAYDYQKSLWVGSMQRLTCVRKDTAFLMKKFPGRQHVLSLTTWGDRWLVIGGGTDLIFLDLLSYYREGKELYYRIDAGSGLTTTEGGQNSFVKESDGSIWWPCNDRVLRFWPEKLLRANHSVLGSPQIFLVRAFGKNQQEINLNETDGIMLNPVYRHVEFLFGSAAMSNYDNLEYRYRLIGRDKEWSKPTNQTLAVFDNLKPGVYRFEVQGSIDGVNWSAAEAFDSFEIQPRWFETIPALALIGILLLGILVSCTWWVSNRRKTILERKKQLNELQLKAIRSKALPHFTGNSFANIDFYIEKGDKNSASKYLAVLSRLHNITLMDSDRASRKLGEELEYVRLYLSMEKLRFEERLNYEIIVDPLVDLNLEVPNMVLHTFAENAIKHGLKNKKGTGLITVEIRLGSGGVYLDVTDDGIGRKAALDTNTTGSQQGIKILSDQIRLYNASNIGKIRLEVIDLVSEDKLPCGTKFSIFIPSNYKY